MEVRNNEQGFTEANVRALCAINNSTKKGIQGYIGQKGIGFKSVFKCVALASACGMQSAIEMGVFASVDQGRIGAVGMLSSIVSQLRVARHDYCKHF